MISPWLFFGKGTKRDCRAYMLAFSKEGVIPTQCRYFCWKVVVPLRSLETLFRFKELLKTLGYLSKCGVDLRNYTDEDYVGFIYCDSQNEAKKVLEELAQPSRVARGCTEMRLYLPTELWGKPDFKQETTETFYIYQSPKAKAEIIREWYNF